MTPFSEAKKFTCYKCTTSFRVEEPPNGGTKRGPCPECGRLFWYTTSNDFPNIAIVGVFPE